MKRSEMVEFMTARFDFYNKKYPGVPLDLIMLYVLKGMQAAGMLPPAYERSPNKDELKAGLEEGDRVFVTEWEPEDENT